MADRTQQILPGGQSAAPFTYTIPASTAFTLLGVKATFDGSGAGGNFLPCVQLVSDAGVVMAFGLGSSVTAGGSADVSFAPFLRGQSSGGASNAVLYDTTPQNGTFLQSTTATGTTIEDVGAAGAGVTLHSSDGAGGGGFVSINTDDGEVFLGSTTIVERIGNSGVLEVQDHSGTVLARVYGSGNVEIRLKSGQQFNVFGPFSKKILRVTDGGGGAATYEQQIGTAWVATL